MGLNYNWSAMTTLVNNMAANGNTNQPIGLVWGWQSLVGGGPFTVPAMDSNYQYSQIIILLTDGLNTEDRWYTGSRLAHRQSHVPERERLRHLRQYQGRRHHASTPSRSIPAAIRPRPCCRTAPATSSKFFLLTSANQIVTTFQAIGTNLTKLRVAK